MRKIAFSFMLISIMAAIGSCKGGAAWKGSVETLDGVQVVRNPKAPMCPEGALELQEELTIGAAEAQGAVKTAMGMGVDAGVLVRDPALLDSDS